MERTPHRRRAQHRNKDSDVDVPIHEDDPDTLKKSNPIMAFMSSIKLFVLCLLCMQNTLFTVLRRYSQGVLKEQYSKVCSDSGAVVHAVTVTVHLVQCSWQLQFF